jgi:SAM-dependent methyltransferase
LDANIPWECEGERFGEAERIACPACGAARHHEVLRRPDSLPIVECEGCGLYFVNPQPTQEALARFYASGYFQGRHDFFQGHDYFAQRDSGIRNRTVTGWSDVEALGVAGRSVLDLGCASGALLVLAREHGASRVKGMELDPQIAARGRKEYGLDVAVGDVTGLLAAERQEFDMVCAFDLVEHVKDPARLFDGVGRVLSRQGHFACSVPNGQCIGVWGGQWIGITENMEHLHYFRPADLTRMAAAAGLKLDSIHTRGFPLRLRNYSGTAAASSGRTARLLRDPRVALGNAFVKSRYSLFGRGIGHELAAVFSRADA